jgi:hypothetical protein
MRRVRITVSLYLSYSPRSSFSFDIPWQPLLSSVMSDKRYMHQFLFVFRQSHTTTLGVFYYIIPFTLFAFSFSFMSPNFLVPFSSLLISNQI